MLASELHLKLTKFTRRPARSNDLLRQGAKAVRFLSAMVVYNLEVIRCSKRCFGALAASGTGEVSLFGERPVIEVLLNLSLEHPVKIARIYKQCGDERNRGGVPLRVGRASNEKIIIGSVVDIARKRELLLKAGIAEERLIQLVPETQA